MMISLFSSTVSASFNIGSDLKSLNINDEIMDYSERLLPIHLNAMISIGEYIGNVNNYNLGEPFTVLNPMSNEVSFFFPVIYENDMIALFKISDDNGELSASLSSYFVNELKTLLLSNTNKEFVLLTDGVILQAYDGNECSTIYKLYEDNSTVSN